MIGEHGCAALARRRAPKLLAQARAVKDVVAEHQHRRTAGDELFADHKRLREPIGLGLRGVFDLDAPFRAVAEQAAEHWQVVRRRDDEDVPDPGQHHDRQRIIDHRLVVDGDKLLRDRKRDRMEPGARAAGQNDAFHRRIRSGCRAIKRNLSFPRTRESSAAAASLDTRVRGYDMSAGCNGMRRPAKSRPRR